MSDKELSFTSWAIKAIEDYMTGMFYLVTMAAMWRLNSVEAVRPTRVYCSSSEEYFQGIAEEMEKESEEALGINHFITNICYFLAVLAARDLVSRQMWDQRII